ncbi:MAG: hypothetical protein BAJALOKI1v1_1320002 [Promethearchaeota archaeon]|nr:MAG: hypothetical protein BAJALOKI1v1_1320002 [Candidatus Lokiarchaeota archaeon]
MQYLLEILNYANVKDDFISP